MQTVTVKVLGDDGSPLIEAETTPIVESLSSIDHLEKGIKIEHMGIEQHITFRVEFDPPLLVNNSEAPAEGGA